MTSQARIDANRRNALLSTGPRSAEGKARSRLNSLTHGLRSEQVVLPTEDAAAFAAHLDAWMADWQPPTMARHQLVERLAVHAWRLKRCVRIEGQVLSKRVNAALAKWDRREDAAVDKLVARLRAEPLDAVVGLQSTRAGVVRLMELWDEVATAAEEPGGWFDVEAHHVRVINLMGFSPEDEEMQGQVDLSWALLLRERPDMIQEGTDDLPLSDERAGAVRSQIVRTARKYVGELREILAELPDDSAERAATAEVEAFAVHKEDAALRRYEGQLDREFRAGLNQLMKLAQTGADLIEDAAPSEPNPETEAIAAPESPGECEPDREATETSGEAGGLSAGAGAGDAEEEGTGGQATGATRANPAGPPSEPNAGVLAVPVVPIVGDLGASSWPIEGPSGAAMPLLVS